MSNIDQKLQELSVAHSEAAVAAQQVLQYAKKQGP